MTINLAGNLTGLKSPRNLPLKLSIRVFSEQFGLEWKALCIQEAVFCLLGSWTEQKEESVLGGKAHSASSVHYLSS